MDFINSHWMVRELRCKSDRVMRAYINLFLRHLCEPESDNTDCYSDQVPREGVSRQHVLTRIGIMAVVRKKVQEFEKINGQYSMPEYAPQDEQQGQLQTPLLQQDETTSALAAPKTERDTGTATGTATGTELQDVKKVEPKVEIVISSGGEGGADEDVVMGGDSGVPVAELKPIVTVPVAMATAATGTATVTATTTTSTQQPPQQNKFMFNIADGGFTELHTIWQNEQRALVEGHEQDIWHRKHDYWLLAGVVAHGYGRWQDIHNDVRFAIVNEPFRNEQQKPNYLEIKNRFLARRFKLLEQALTIEEQLRRAAQLNLAYSPNDQVQNLNRRFTELECLATSQQNVYTEAVQGNKTLVPVLHRGEASSLLLSIIIALFRLFD